MSILFEAWRRAQRGGSQWSRTLGAAPAVPLRRRSSWLPWLLCGLLVALAAALGVYIWLVLGQSERQIATSPPQQRVTATAKTPPHTPAVPTNVANPAQQDMAATPQPGANNLSRSPVIEADKPGVSPLGTQARTAVEDKPAVRVNSQTEPPALSVPAQPVTLATLPDAVRRDFPALDIVAHVWNSDPRLRFLVAGGRRLQEGDLLAPGVRLIEITRRGEIVAFRGYRIVLP